jgi:hypothetical protein
MSRPLSLTATMVCAALLCAVSPGARGPLAAQAPAAIHRSRVAVFLEAGFPSVDIVPISDASLREALSGLDVEWLGVEDLSRRLDGSRYDVLVMPFGSAYPEAAWPAILKYLEAGGNWVNLGGRPFTVAVSRQGDHWSAQPASTAAFKALGFTHSFEVPATVVADWVVAPSSPAVPAALATGFRADIVYEMDVRLANTKDYPEEDGSDGRREGREQALVVGRAPDHRAVAAPFVRIDRLAGRYSGGTWILAAFSGSLAPGSIRALVDSAAIGAVEFTAAPTFAGYLPGETPAIDLALRRPAAAGSDFQPLEVHLTLVDANGRTAGTASVRLSGTRTYSTARVEWSGLKTPLARGLYEVRAKIDLGLMAPGAPATLLDSTTGFWVYDASMLRGGTPLVASADGFARGGHPFAVTGTTYMASYVHRRFLLEPNPHLWDRDFAAMKAAGVNLVRTGIWTGWKSYMPAVGRLNEAAFRSLDVFLLTARRYDIPIIFNLFAFLPEAWGGQNPYLDPRSVEAQQIFAGTLTRRYAGVGDLAWDLINEPSFSSAGHLWKTRPNGDRFEAAAWEQWLRSRYGTRGDDYRAAALRAWGATPDDDLSLPAADDFADRNLFGTALPRKSADYKRFAQDMFRAWVVRMTEAIRGNGDTAQLITVGQDEGGLGESPSPLLFGRSIDFTCIHNWWNNDALAWDGILSRLPDRPLLTEETGLMRYERIDGTPWRTEREAADLLERKMAVAVGTGSAGFVQWIWNTNPYMASDNEAGIGFLRADGTARPELEPFIRVSRFLRANAERFRGREAADVVLLVPQSQMFSPRGYGVDATKRAVRVLTNNLHASVRAVSELDLQASLGSPRLIVAPSPRVLTDQAWQQLLSAVEDGATLLVTGPIDADEHWRQVERTKPLGLAAASRPVASHERILIGSMPFDLGFHGDQLVRVETALVAGESEAAVHRVARGKGAILWMPVPVEISDSVEATSALYRSAFEQAGVEPAVSVEPTDGSVLVGAERFADVVLVALVSDSGADRDIVVTLRNGLPARLHLPAGRATLLLFDRRTGKLLATDRGQ